jgi:hypothetical protein
VWWHSQPSTSQGGSKDGLEQEAGDEQP